MLNGHPGNITRACKRAAVRIVNAGLVVTSTTDGQHAKTSLHYARPPRRKKGHAIDGAPLNSLSHEKRLERMRRFQRAELERGARLYDELFGPLNDHCVKNGMRITLANHSALEDQHDTHVHVAPRAGVVGRAARRVHPTRAARDLLLARRAKRHGGSFSLRIIREARLAQIPVSLGFALIEQETGFRNVWGRDGPPNGSTAELGGRKVTKADYLAYKRRRGTKGQGGMQGVGPAQLTWFSLQDSADFLGGCWVPRHNIRVAFHRLAALISVQGEFDGLRAYNGTGQAAVRYAREVKQREAKWHKALT
jgi:hypothetical protein